VIALEAFVAAVMAAVTAGVALGFLGCSVSALCAVTIRLGRHPRFLIPPPLR